MASMTDTPDTDTPVIEDDGTTLEEAVDEAARWADEQTNEDRE